MKNSNGFEKVFNIKRLRKSSVPRRRPIEQFYSDRSRIIYSSSFRRLQQKAQVFSLESNSSVRTRMTHSLEVADIGRTLADKIGQRLKNNKYINSDIKVLQMVAIVENACLLHDIGNPPFGHFGEAAIREWAKSRIREIASKSVSQHPDFEKLISDFIEFDGNPQGFRIITRLHTDNDEYSLNLTYSTLMCALKYVRSSGDKKGTGIKKKAGFFITEKDIVEKLYKETGFEIGHRYPLTYIMEAADDIAYCLSDIHDGIVKRIITLEEFVVEFTNEWKKAYPNKPIPKVFTSKIKDFNLDISIKLSKLAMEEAANNFIENYSEFFNGSATELINGDSEIGKVFKIIKNVSRRLLYSSIEAESIELTGYSVISGILAHYEKILKMDYSDFKKLVNNEPISEFDVEKRLFNRIGIRYVKAYKFALGKITDDDDIKTYEWWLRIHMIIDHISGMTDEFALETYQMLSGISLMKV